MPWQPFTPESGQRKALRDDSPDSLASMASRTDRYRRRPSHLEEFVSQENGMKSPAKLAAKLEDNTERAERRIKEKSSYKKLISNLQSTYQDLTQEQALRGILALRVENNGTLSGMTMLEITEGVIRFVKSNYDTNPRLEENPASRNINSDDADGENSSLDDPVHSSERKLEIVESDNSGISERRLETEILRIPLVRQKKVPALGGGPSRSSTDSEGDHSSDDSYTPDMEVTSHRKRTSPKKKDEQNQSPEKISPKPRTPRKKIEKVQLSVEDIEAEYPKICRKRKFPSHFHEFSLPHPEPEDPDELAQDKQEAFHLYPKIKVSKKKRKETEDKENHNSGNKDTGDYDGDDGDDDITLTGKAKGHGQCALCGMRFDQNSKKVEMTEKTRETGQTFADMLYGLFQDESLPPSLAERAKCIELDEGFLCTLCVSYVDQMDVFQKKLSEIKSSILDVFIQKSKRESARPSEKSSVLHEDKEQPKVARKRGRPPKVKAGSAETVTQSAPLKSDNIELNSSQSSKPSNPPEEDPDLAQKLSVLSGIEIKRVNTETGVETEAVIKKVTTELEAGYLVSADNKTIKKRSPKKYIPLSETSDSSFADACDRLEDELTAQTENQSDLVTPVRPNLSSRGRGSSRSRGQGRGRGRGRGGPVSGGGTPVPLSVTPAPPPAKSKKSLFEQSQERKRLSQGSGQYSANGVTVSPAPSPPVYSVPVSPALVPSPQTPDQLRQKRAYRKLVARIQGVHPDLTEDEALQGIIAVRDSNNGTLTGMSMQEIITLVRESVPELSPPIGEEFEKMVFAPLNEKPPAPAPTPAPIIEETKLFEMKCQFCSRMFKSSSEVATKKVYEMHLHEHEVENRNVFEERDTGEPDQRENCQTTDGEIVRPEETRPKPCAGISTESQLLPSQTQTSGDPVRSEISYCKICLKQFKNSKLYGIHQNTEHAAEKEFEKISNSS